MSRLVHFGSREAMNIEHLGEKTARQVVERGLVNDLADLYHLNAGQLKQLDRFADRSARKLFASIQESKRPTLERFLYALGIRHVGSVVARQLTRRFKTLAAAARPLFCSARIFRRVSQRHAQDAAGTGNRPR